MPKIAAVALVTVALLIAAAEPVRAQAACTPLEPVNSWQSTGDLTTAPVTIAGTYARLDVETEKQVCIRTKRLDGMLLKGECMQQSGSTYVYGGPGTTYFEFSSLGAWSARLTDMP